MTTLIDRLAGIDLGSPLETVFAARTEARAQVELCYQLLLHPAEPGPVSLLERHAVAAFVAAMHDQAETRDHYRALLQRTDADEGHTANIVLWEAENTRAAGPYGHFPKGPLSVEDRDGPAYRVSKERGEELGVRLAAALEQADC
ncbi:MAG: CMD domain protein [Paracoccaceae bacterium]